jgi:hypothetical protein
MVGIGSGITMLAACSTGNVKILEVNVSPSLTMKSCGYADSLAFNNAKPEGLIEYIRNNK